MRRRFAEIEARGGFDAERLIGKTDAVQIFGQNFRFGIFPLDAQRHEHFAAFAPRRARIAEMLLDKLLRDGGRAGDDAPGHEVLRDRPPKREGVHAGMRKKAVIFDFNQSVHDRFRQLRIRQPCCAAAVRRSRFAQQNAAPVRDFD